MIQGEVLSLITICQPSIFKKGYVTELQKLLNRLLFRLITI